MRGGWLAKIGSAIARKETFERMVAPAIADMQIEASYGRVHRWKHYAAIGMVLVHALLRDLRLDVASAFDAEARRMVWKRAAIWYAGFVALFTFLGVQYNLPSGMPMTGIWSAALTSTGIEAIVTAVSIATSAAVFYLWRRSSSRRSIIPAVLLIATLTIAFALIVRPIRRAADRILDDSIQERMSSSRWMGYKADDLDEYVTWWQDIQSGVSVIPSAFIGIVLARSRGWKVALTIVLFFVSWFLVVWVLHWLGSIPSPSLVLQRWREIAINTTVAIIWLTSDRFRRRVREPAAEV